MGFGAEVCQCSARVVSENKWPRDGDDDDDDSDDGGGGVAVWWWWWW